MKFKGDDGSEWEGILGINDIVHNTVTIKRIPPKEKSLYEKVEAASELAGSYTGGIKILSSHIESLEKRVEELKRKMSAIERACEYWDDDALLRELKK